MEKNTGKVREKSGNFVSPEKWEPCQDMTLEKKTRHEFRKEKSFHSRTILHLDSFPFEDVPLSYQEQTIKSQNPLEVP